VASDWRRNSKQEAAEANLKAKRRLLGLAARNYKQDKPSETHYIGPLEGD